MHVSEMITVGACAVDQSEPTVRDEYPEVSCVIHVFHLNREHEHKHGDLDRPPSVS